jgi:hypothetical protein
MSNLDKTQPTVMEATCEPLGDSQFASMTELEFFDVVTAALEDFLRRRGVASLRIVRDQYKGYEEFGARTSLHIGDAEFELRVCKAD